MANTVQEIENRLEGFLRQLEELERQINLRMNRLGSLRQQNERCCSNSYGTTGMVNAGLCVSIIELEREIDMYVDRLVDMKKEMQGLISCVDDPGRRAQLGRRYTPVI